MIIPVYNVKNYLKSCLSSIIEQTYGEFEIILIDDGSDDRSCNICDDFLLLDSRTKVIHQINKGAACAKNTGLDFAVGDYISFIDSDDTVSDRWLEIMVLALERNEADISECCFDKVYTNQVIRETIFYQHEEFFSAEKYLSFYLSDWSCSLFWNKLFKSELLKGIRFHSERRCIDDEFFTYKVLSRAKKILRINEVLYHYRQRLSGAVYSENHQVQITNDALDVLIERYQWINKVYPYLRGTYFSHDIAIMNYFAHDFNFDEYTVKKFYRIRRYYLLRFWVNPSKQVFINLIKLLLMSKKILLKAKPQNAVKDKEKYYI